MAQINTFTLPSNADHLNLSVLTVEPDNAAPCGLLQLAHGMAEHKERYLPFMKFMAEHGYACIINDHRGHGASVKSEKDLGYFYAGGADAVVEDLHQITQYFRGQHPGLKLFLFGHSMGSLAVRAYRLKYDREIDGLIVCGSPGKNPAAGAGLMLLKLMSALRGERHISPLFMNMTTGSFAKRYPDPNTQSGWLSANPDNVKDFDADPLCGFPFTLNGYRALLTLMRQAYDTHTQPGHPDMPVHFVSGADDPCAPDASGFEAAAQAMRDAGYSQVSAKMYPGMRHEILNETGRQQVFDDLLDKLNQWNH